MIGDLHCHTKFSDGSLGIDELVFYAKRSGLDFVSATDHDTMAGVNRAEQLGKRYGIGVIPGAELSTMDKTRRKKAHLLCYLPRHPDRLEGAFRRMLEMRDKALRESLHLVMQRYPVTEEHVMRYAKGAGSLYVVHIMQALRDLGYTELLFGELYQKLLSPAGICHRPHPYPDVFETAELIRSAGGVCVLAHPSVYDSIELLAELAERRLIDGVERYHPRTKEEDIPRMEEIIAEYGLIATGGTDFHGGFSAKPAPLGTCLTMREQLERLFKLAKSRS